MTIIKISDAKNIPSEELEDWDIPNTIGEPQALWMNPADAKKGASGRLTKCW